MSTMARASSISLKMTPASFISLGTAMNTGAFGPSCESQMQMQLGRDRAEASQSTCPGTRWGWEMLTTWLPSCTYCSRWPLRWLHLVCPRMGACARPEDHWETFLSCTNGPLGAGEGFSGVGGGSVWNSGSFLTLLLGSACSLTQSWCWSQQDSTQPLGTLRGRCRQPPSALLTSHSCCKCWLEAGFVLCWSALESIQSVRAAQAPHWTSLQQGRAPGPSPSICPTEGRPLPLLPGGPTGEAAALGLLGFHPTPASPVHMAVALTGPSATLALSPEVLLQEEVSVGRQETEAWARWAGQAWGGASVLCLQLMYCQLVHLFLWLAHHRQHESLTQDKALSALGKFLFLADGILNGKVTCGIAAIPACAKAATLDVAIRQSLSRGAQRLLCLVLGELDWPLDIADDGRILWLNIGGKETAVRSAFHISTPLPGTTGGFLNYTLGLVLPLAYSFQPELVLVTVGPAQGLQDPHVALLAAMLRIPAAGRVLALLEEESASQLVTTLAPVLHGEAPPSLGPFLMASPEDIQTLKCLRAQLEPRWKLLQVASEAQGEAGSCHRVPLGKPPSGTNYTDQACS
ncbi:PREDICTED: histone deacetylase 10 isoform X4 [Dipodomys ordii]|uniref:Histone deacetylase 10 isoform X4 n=1 Tax=Dipodomys ordii TaxID=10020 RepID=A0A1S3FXC9_DIPOR|nr:PREDICTED: histone deacetylase 10 isoform X4 [Dipodomys ordii]